MRSLPPAQAADGVARNGTAAAVIEVEGSTPDARNLLILPQRSSGLRSVGELTRTGIAPEGFRIFIFKGAVAPYRTLQDVAARFILAASPGPTDVDLSKFEFKLARRPLEGVK